jgi:hypothetical protein
MPSLSLPPSVPVSQVGRAAHDVGLAGMLGGQLFGRMALHPAVTRISDPRERGEVVNAAWRRYGAVNGLGLLAVTSGWIGARAAEAADRNLSPREQRLARARDALLAVVFAGGVGNAVQGMRFAKQGATPMLDGDTPAPNASPQAKRIKRTLNGLSLLSIGSELALVAVNAAFSQETFRRPPLRRRLTRSR